MTMTEAFSAFSLTLFTIGLGSLIGLIIPLFCIRSDCKFCKYAGLLCCKLLQLKRGGELVILLDWKNTTYVTLAYPVRGKTYKRSYVYPFHRIGDILLQEDGKVTELNGSFTYISFWLPYNKADRTFMILQHDTKLFNYI